MMFMNVNAQSKSSNLLKHNQKSDDIIKFTRLWADRLVGNDNTISYERQNYASDKNNKIQISLTQIKTKLKHTFTNTIYKPLTFYQFHMIDHLHNLYKDVNFAKIAQSIPEKPYVQNYIKIIAFTKQIVHSEDVAQNLKKYVTSHLESISKTAKKTKYADNKKPQSLYTEMQINIILMILTFKSLEKQYNPYVRKVIKRIFNQLSADTFLNTTETLRYLENERPEIQNMLHITQDQLTEKNKKILRQTFQKYQRKDTIPNIKLVKVSQNQRRKVVNILISGFLSQDQDKKAQWKGLLNCMPDSEVYGLDWQSQKIPKLLQFMATSVKDLLFTEKTLQNKFQDNPFNPAFKVAQDSGKYLAHIVHQVFPDQFINIIGYSLGTELIKEFVNTTIILNEGKNLQKIVLLGGVSHIIQYDQILKKCKFPLNITNMYTANDSVLQILLKRCRKNIEPIGLKQLLKSTMHCIDNTDVSKQISGHLAYMTSFEKVADLLELCEE